MAEKKGRHTRKAYEVSEKNMGMYKGEYRTIKENTEQKRGNV